MTIPLGMCGKMFGHFETDEEFIPEAKNIVDMYEHACEKTFYFSKRSVPDGKYKQKALVWMAAATTLHTLLGMYKTGDGIFEADDEIDFNWIEHLADQAEGEDK